MDNNQLYCVIIGAIAVCYLVVQIIDGIVEAKRAKWGAFAAIKKDTDLTVYTAWLYEKGVLREGFKHELLAEEFHDESR